MVMILADTVFSHDTLLSQTGELQMAWWYELRGAENRLVEMRRGFATEREAQEGAERALKKIKSVAYPNTETLTVVTGADEEPKAKSKAAN
jgi:hypothetical protein